MVGFLKLSPPDQARQILCEQVSRSTRIERIPTQEGLDRVIAQDILAPHALPQFRRSTVDGYALRARDTQGARESLPAYLKLIGEVPMGTTPYFSIKAGECTLIHTGGMLPVGADAVVMVENTQAASPDEIEIFRDLAVGDNVIQEGEDVQAGQLVIPAGARLRAAEIGGLLAFGILEIEVFSRPVVGIVSCGDEVIPPDQAPALGQVRDINAYTLSALIRKAGGLPVYHGIVNDDEIKLKSLAQQVLASSDILVITAGSSASERDLTAGVVQSLGSPGVLVHGVALRPGKPTILAVCASKPVIGLPGNPVSALVVAWLFLAPVIEQISGLKFSVPRPSVASRLAINIPSQAGREDWAPVKLTWNVEQEEWMAEPVFGKSNLIYTLVRADGLVRVPIAANGLSAGEPVNVFLFQA